MHMYTSIYTNDLIIYVVGIDIKNSELVFLYLVYITFQSIYSTWTLYIANLRMHAYLYCIEKMHVIQLFLLHFIVGTGFFLQEVVKKPK